MTDLVRGTAAEQFHVVMLYDRLASVGRGMATYSHLSRELENDCQSDLRIWRLDVASSDEFAPQAGDDIAGADVVIVSVRGNEPCPPAFRHWREGGGAAGGGAPHGIIALVEPSGEPSGAPDTWNAVLKGAATQIHPEVFVYEPSAADASPATAAATP